VNCGPTNADRSFVRPVTLNFGERYAMSLRSSQGGFVSLFTCIIIVFVAGDHDQYGVVGGFAAAKGGGFGAESAGVLYGGGRGSRMR